MRTEKLDVEKLKELTGKMVAVIFVKSFMENIDQFEEELNEN